jgi:NADH:ubiquinone oxidoreductase subunit 6 (subunit J)
VREVIARDLTHSLLAVPMKMISTAIIYRRSNLPLLFTSNIVAYFINRVINHVEGQSRY